jgi:hypothetical protein
MRCAAAFGPTATDADLRKIFDAIDTDQGAQRRPRSCMGCIRPTSAQKIHQIALGFERRYGFVPLCHGLCVNGGQQT